MINTYGVFGKIQFVMSVQIGNQSVTVDFSGGGMSSRGVIPASYVTNNPLVQRALHLTAEYRSGIVKLIKSIPEKVDLLEAERQKAEEEAAKKVEKEVEKKLQDASFLESDGCEDDAVASGQTRVEVSCLDDAVEYLKANYEGYSASKLRTKASVVKAGEEHGVVFVGL
ncbi:hypothetical protein EVA_02466 [gut metagenome]|uniref:Uncharacterized protein n=1 Tax=gut metagenome TaxID=749906 RepID=J9H5X0_9ZZZZ